MNKQNEPSHALQSEPADETLRLMKVLDYAFFNLAHELGNPINSIKMTMEVLISNHDAYDAATRLEYLKSIHAEFRRLEELLNALRSFNMFERLSIRSVDVQLLVRDLLQMLHNEIDEKEIMLASSFLDEPVWVSCDPRALHQALLQVVGNAIDALGGRPDPVLAVTVTRCDGHCRIAIADNGGGIPDDKIEEAFMPFYSSKPQGAGLGLTLARKLLARMNGRIEICGRRPQGAEVRITLPLSEGHGN